MDGAQIEALPRSAPQPSCPLCGRRGGARHTGLRDRAHTVGETWSLRCCAYCRIGWIDPRPAAAAIGLCYPPVHDTHDPRPAAAPAADAARGRLRDAVLAGHYGHERPQVGALRRRLGRMLGRLGPVRYRLADSHDRSMPMWRSGGRLLDIGCGAGHYLRLAQAHGWRTWGLDADPLAVEVARATGAVVQQGTLETARFDEAPFDAVVSMHSIEHAADPGDFLRRALSLLRPGGFFYLRTPNVGSLLHRRFGPDWYARETPRHLCLLSVPALRRLLETSPRWSSLTVRSNPRRAWREQEQTLAMRRLGSFEARPPLSLSDHAHMTAWTVLEHAGNRFLHWGEEVEAIGFKG